MRTQRRVFEKLALNSNKYEFNLDKDYDKIVKVVSTLTNNLDDAESKFDNVLKPAYEKLAKDFNKTDAIMLSNLSKLKKAIPDLENLKKKYDTITKELGINPKDIKLYNKLLQQIKLANIYYEGGNDINKDLRKYLKALK